MCNDWGVAQWYRVGLDFIAFANMRVRIPPRQIFFVLYSYMKSYPEFFSSKKINFMQKQSKNK